MTNGTENMDAMDPKDVAPDPNSNRTLTLGERRVRVSFNPSAITIVEVLQKKSAELIDLVQMVRNDAGVNPSLHPDELGEVFRLVALAQTAYEEACMFAVKAATS